MTEPVLSDDEKNALLDGVASGAVEVRSADGPRYASVQPFVIGPRARLVTNGLPRLASLNEQLAGSLATAAGGRLRAAVDITAGATRTLAFAELGELWPARALAVSFGAAPLPGQALVIIDPVLTGPLVEAFYGGNSPGSTAHPDATHSPGALAIVQLFVSDLLSALAATWAPLSALTPRPAATRIGLDLVEVIAEDEPVVACEFDVSFADGEQHGAFCIVWPEATLAPIRAALEGRRRERDAAEDARWARVLRQRLAEVPVEVSSKVGHARMTLGQLIDLKPGDVIGIDTPRVATLLARGVPLIEGRFGVQAGRNAVEAVAWLQSDTAK